MTSCLMTRKKQLNSFHTTTLTKYHFILQTDTNTYHEALNLYRPIIIETYNHRAHIHISLKPIIPHNKRGCNRMRFHRILVAVPLKYKKHQEN